MNKRKVPRWRQLDDLPIRGKLTLLVLMSSALGLLLTAGILLAYMSSATRSSTVRDLQTLANIMADSTSAALAFGDPRAAADTLDSLKAHSDIEQACLYGSGPVLKPATGSTLFAQFVRDEPCPGAAVGAALEQGAETLTVTTPVNLAGERLGTLQLTQSLQRQRRALWILGGLALGIGAFSFLASGAVAWLMQRAITAPLLRLAQTAQHVSETRDYHVRVDRAGSDEVGRLIEDFNQMLEQIAQREAALHSSESELRRVNTSLETQVHETRQALQQLRDTQTQLLQSEKLASLGSMVAGLAHEINTPLGVGVSAASTLQALAEQIRQRHDSGQMTRSDLHKFVQLAIDSADMVLRNLQRASELIQSFKQVAVDQASDERRKFALKNYLDEIIVSLSPKLRGTRHRITVRCPPDLMLDSYPGALAQIVTNFITNSLTHGFTDEREGHMEVDVAYDASTVTLRYRDDGAGIDPAHLDRVFDPFFTTRRGTGGSGLGLNVVYNLVTQRLGGTVEVHSELGKGCEFLVQFPLHAGVPAAVPEQRIRGQA